MAGGGRARAAPAGLQAPAVGDADDIMLQPDAANSRQPEALCTSSAVGSARELSDEVDLREQDTRSVEEDATTADIELLAQQCARRWCLKAEAYVRQRPLLPETVPAGLYPTEARRSQRCRDYLLGGGGSSSSTAWPSRAEGKSEDAEVPTCTDSCLLLVTDTHLVHYTRRPKDLQSQKPEDHAGAQIANGAAHPEEGDKQEEPAIDDKYWKRRFNYFSRFDEGIRMDAAAWFEVTPESVARHIADRMQYGLVVDGTCGVGGNAIQFALTSSSVIAVDTDEARLRDAAHNAELYGVRDRIRFVHDDFVNFADTYDRKIPVDAVFLSPPWGGPAHLDAEYFGLKDVERPDIVQLFAAATRVSPRVVLYLPRHIDLHETVILAAAHGFETVEVEKVFFQYPTPHLKLVVLYFTPEAQEEATRAAGRNDVPGASAIVRHKTVGASARGSSEQQPRRRQNGSGPRDRSISTATVDPRNGAHAARCGPSRPTARRAAPVDSHWADGLLRLPPLVGPVVRALVCRHHYIGRYVVGLAVAIGQQRAAASPGVVAAAATSNVGGAGRVEAEEAAEERSARRKRAR